MADWRRDANKDSPNLGVWDIEGHSPLEVVIERYGTSEVHSVQGDGKKKVLPFIWFKGKQKGLGLAKVNCFLIETLHGADTQGWIGKKITLRTASVVVQGQAEPCIRIGVPAGTKIPARYRKFTYTDNERPQAKAAPRDPVRDGPVGGDSQ